MTMKTAMMKWTLGLSVATLSIGGIAHAQQDLPPRPMMHGKSMMDADGNGVVTRAEAQQKAEEMFAMMDVNKDGKLDQADREARRQEMRSRLFDKLDANHDGSISKEEFMADKGPEGRHPPMNGPEGPRGPGMGGGAGMHGMHGMRGGHMMMAMADANHDGVITKDEFMAAAMKHFDMADTNHDGKLTKEERQAAHAKMKAEWMAKKPDAH